MTTLSQITAHLTAPFRDHQPSAADAPTVPLHVVKNNVEHANEHDGGGHHHRTSAARRTHPVSIVLWLTGPITAAVAVFGFVAPRWLMIGVLLLIVQATNRFGLHKYGVPVWIKLIFVACTLAAALMAVQPVISERAVAIVQGAIAGATGNS